MRRDDRVVTTMRGYRAHVICRDAEALEASALDAEGRLDLGGEGLGCTCERGTCAIGHALELVELRLPRAVRGTVGAVRCPLHDRQGGGPTM